VWWGIYISLCYKFPTESNSERILKIGIYLVKLWARVRCLVFFDSQCSVLIQWVNCSRCPYTTRRTICNGRVSVRPSVCPVNSSRFSLHICRRRQSAAASRQRQCFDPRTIDAYLSVCAATRCHFSDYGFVCPHSVRFPSRQFSS